MLRVFMNSGVLESLEKEYTQHLEGPRGTNEVGWLLAGSYENGSLNVLASIQAGELALSSCSHVKFDAEDQSKKMVLVRSKHGGMIFPCGVVHSHPGNQSHPSRGDYRGDLEWIKQLPGREGLFGIGTCQKQTCFSWYVLSENSPDYDPVEVTVIHGNDLRV
jgi:proteasome lid subunit RPN8/RPN11